MKSYIQGTKNEKNQAYVSTKCPMVLRQVVVIGMRATLDEYPGLMHDQFGLHLIFVIFPVEIVWPESVETIIR